MIWFVLFCLAFVASVLFGILWRRNAGRLLAYRTYAHAMVCEVFARQTTGKPELSVACPESFRGTVASYTVSRGSKQLVLITIHWDVVPPTIRYCIGEFGKSNLIKTASVFELREMLKEAEQYLGGVACLAPVVSHAPGA